MDTNHMLDREDTVQGVEYRLKAKQMKKESAYAAAISEYMSRGE